MIEPDFLDHFAAAHERGHGFEKARLAIEHAAGGRAAHLVAAEREEIAIQRLHIDRHVRDALRAVHENDARPSCARHRRSDEWD